MAYKEAQSPKSKGKRLDHLKVSQGEDGGHVVEHNYADDGLTYHKPVKHVFGKDEGEDLMAHVAKHMHVSHSEDQEDGEE